MNSYLHIKKNNLKYLYLFACILLIIFGFYKNGILLYKEIKEFKVLIKPLSFSFVTIVIGLIFTIIKNKKIILDNNLIYMLLIALCIPLKTSIIYYSVFVLICNLLLLIIDKFDIKINYVCLFKLLLVLLLIKLNRYTYLNSLEELDRYSYNLLDIFFGRGISGISSSAIFLILICYGIFCTNYYYKKEIPIISFAIYIVVSFIYKILFSKVMIFNSMILFAMVFIAPLLKLSPASFIARVVYAVIVGILTFICTYFINMYEGVFIAIFISSILNYINIDGMSNFVERFIFKK